MSNTIKAYGTAHDLSDFSEVRAFELNGVTFTIWFDRFNRSYTWAIDVAGKVMDEASSHEGFTCIDELGLKRRGFDSIEDAFKHMAANAKDAEEYRKLYDEQEERGKRFAAYFEEHGTIPTGMSDLDAILGGGEEQ